ncbi:hypothetical protein [Sphingomonas sp.]|uniref:hypothetical protein n=1 Tax=Sphingomonas sp. TaxID=28214 RepID=UPI002ED985BA
MHATVETAQMSKQGFLGAKMRYQVSITLFLNTEELEAVHNYAPHDPWLRNYVELDEGDHSRLAKQGATCASGFSRGVTMEFASIQAAGKFEDGVIEALRAYQVQVRSAQARAARLNVEREINLDA